jgi:ubiquinol-cytochrome c reductase cytochrome c1 subunit
MMMKKMSWFFGVVLLCSVPLSAHSHGALIGLQAAHIDPYDKASLQRGAAVFVNYCMGCHSLEYMRYNGVAKDIGLVDSNGRILEKTVKTKLNFVSDKVTDNMHHSMPKTDAAKWFGVSPPDLTLIARVRGVDWLYSYLKGFYKDESRPWGVNNFVFPDVGMPHVLLELQGVQEAVFQTHGEHKVLVGLELKTPGSLSVEEYDQVVRDLVNFLEYAGEPIKVERQRLGVWVLLFLTIFLVFAYLLKREYWKDVY